MIVPILAYSCVKRLYPSPSVPQADAFTFFTLAGGQRWLIKQVTAT